jgi:spermidine/putrescine transport system permease protein
MARKPKLAPSLKSNELAWFGYPILVWLLFFMAAPLALVAGLGFFSRGEYGGVEPVFTLSNFSRALDPIYFHIFLRSIQLSICTALICLILAYPMAWAMASAPQKWRHYLSMGLAIPFMTNLIIRVYAIKLCVGMDGPLQTALTFLHIHFDPYMISQNPVLVFYGMITSYLPFMVFPIYAALEKFDFSLVEAAEDLGASQLSVLLKVIIPNTRVAAVNSFTLVFVPCLGEFVIPDLLGGAKTMLAGNLITEQFLKARDWPFGAALSVGLMGVLLVFPWVLRRLFLRPGVTA